MGCMIGFYYKDNYVTTEVTFKHLPFLTLADRLLGRKSFSMAAGGGFFLFVPFLLFSSLSPIKNQVKSLVLICHPSTCNIATGIA